MAKNTKKVTSEVTEIDEAKAKKLAEAKALRDSLNAAKNTLSEFIDTPEYNALTTEVQGAIKRLAKKLVKGVSSTYGQLKDLFPEVGTKIDEFEMFKRTKMGVAEVRKKVFYSWKKCEPSEKLWIRHDEANEEFVLDGIGEEMPSNWTENMLPKTRNVG